MNVNHSLDVQGKPCPVPIVMIKKKMSKIKEGEVLEVTTSALVAKENIERYCKKKYELIKIDEEDNGIFKIYIKK